VTVQKILESFEEKIRALLHRRITGLDAEKFTAKRLEGNVTLEIPEEGFLLEGLQIMKQAAAADILKYYPDIGEVSFIEVIKRKEQVASERPQQEMAVESSSKQE